MWLDEREHHLADDWRAIDSIASVEELLLKYDDFCKTLDAQDEKFNALKKLTLVRIFYSISARTYCLYKLYLELTRWLMLRSRKRLQLSVLRRRI